MGKSSTANIDTEVFRALIKRQPKRQKSLTKNAIILIKRTLRAFVIVAINQESISLIEPLMPPTGNKKLENLAMDLNSAACRLNQSVNPVTRRELGNLVRSMNCYYSNLIEGHRTLPKDIEKFLSGRHKMLKSRAN